MQAPSPRASHARDHLLGEREPRGRRQGGQLLSSENEPCSKRCLFPSRDRLDESLQYPACEREEDPEFAERGRVTG